jgi:hypothetical protein
LIEKVMAEFFSSGRAVDLIIAVLALEALFLIGWRRRAVVNVIAAVSPGICLLLALRVALTGAAWVWIALWLALSFPAHLADLWRRPP